MTDEVNILADEKPKSIKLADGKEYILPPITLHTLANIEDALGCGIDKIQEQFSIRTAGTLEKVTYAMLRENHPHLTLEQVGKLVTPDKFKPIIEAISNAMSELKT